MHCIILGAGVVGFQIARQLISEGKDVVLIEKDPERAKYVSNSLDCIVINEVGNKSESLKRAGIRRADFFISVTNSDEVNMIACGMVAGEFDVPVKIARVRSLDYSTAKFEGKPFFGIDFIVNSEVETARLIANTVALGADSDVVLFQNSDFHMRNIIVDSASYFNGKTVEEIRKAIREEFLIAGIIREGSFIIPAGNTEIRSQDNIYILATRPTMTRIFMEIGKKSEKIDKIIIVGGGKIGFLVCQYLIRTGRKITIIEKDFFTCKRLSEQFPDALVLNADISDERVFEEELLDEYDLIITTTDNQEINILTSVYAKSIGVRKAVSLVAKSNYVPIASTLGIDATIDPKISTVDAILKFVRRGDIKSVHSLFDRKVEIAEVIELSVNNNSESMGKKVKEIEMPEESLILTITREGQDFIPMGNSVIKKGDTVITIVKKDSIERIEQLFSG